MAEVGEKGGVSEVFFGFLFFEDGKRGAEKSERVCSLFCFFKKSPQRAPSVPSRTFLSDSRERERKRERERGGGFPFRLLKLFFCTLPLVAAPTSPSPPTFKTPNSDPEGKRLPQTVLWRSRESQKTTREARKMLRRRALWEKGEEKDLGRGGRREKIQLETRPRSSSLPNLLFLSFYLSFSVDSPCSNKLPPLLRCSCEQALRPRQRPWRGARAGPLEPRPRPQKHHHRHHLAVVVASLPLPSPLVAQWSPSPPSPRRLCELLPARPAAVRQPLLEATRPCSTASELWETSLRS